MISKILLPSHVLHQTSVILILVVKTYDALVKRKGVDMILPLILAMDKTQVDAYG
jgi:hypothetical protein